MSKMSGLLPYLKDEFVEICIGDEYEEIVQFDNVKKVNSVIYGKLKDIIDDFAVLDCFSIDFKDQVTSGNIVYVNTWQIKAITKITQSSSLNDILASSGAISKIKNSLNVSNKVKKNRRNKSITHG